MNGSTQKDLASGAIRAPVVGAILDQQLVFRSAGHTSTVVSNSRPLGAKFGRGDRVALPCAHDTVLVG